MRRLSFIPLSLMMLAVISCVNQEYDLAKINTDEIAGLKGIALPVGSTDTFVLKDILPEDLGDFSMSVDQDGNLMLSMDGHVDSDEISVPSFSLEGYYEDKIETTTVLDPIYVSETGENSGFISEPVPFYDIVYNIDIHQTDIPKEIIDVRYADITSLISIGFNYDSSQFPFEKLWISSGSRVIFPELVILDDAPSGFERVSDHEMVFKDDFAVLPSGSHADFPIKGADFTKLPEDQGFVSRGEFHGNFDVVVSGLIFIRAQDCKQAGVFEPEFGSVITLEKAVLNSVTASVEIDQEMKSLEKDFIVKNVPEYLKGDAACLDFNALRLNLSINNRLPFDGLLSTAFATYQQDDSLPLWESRIDDLLLPSLSPVCYSLSETGIGAPEGFTDVSVTGLNSFLRVMPDSYTLRGNVEPCDEYIEIVPGSKYMMSLDYEFIAPLSFGPDFRLQITEDIHNLNVSIQEVTVTEAIVKLDAVNAVPLSFVLEAHAIDAEGNLIEAVSATIDKPIAAGTLDSPSVNPVQITLSAQGNLSFEGIRLTVTADSPAEAPLNDDQYFKFENISLHLPEGITYHNQ